MQSRNQTQPEKHKYEPFRLDDVFGREGLISSRLTETRDSDARDYVESILKGDTIQ